MGVGRKDENRKKGGGEKSRKVWTSKPPLFFFLHERRRSINTMIITAERERKRERMCVLHFDDRMKRERESEDGGEYERRWRREYERRWRKMRSKKLWQNFLHVKKDGIPLKRMTERKTSQRERERKEYQYHCHNE